MHTHSKAGIIAGSVIGGIILIAGVVLAGYYLVRRRRWTKYRSTPGIGRARDYPTTSYTPGVEVTPFAQVSPSSSKPVVMSLSLQLRS